MNVSQNVIAATLSDLDVPLSITALDDRKLLQKAIYLAQEAGVDLGYRYGWHLLGPYSTSLAEDCLSAGSIDGDGSITPLRATYRKKLAMLKPFFEPPAETKLSKSQWLELLAALHFLRKYVGQTDSQARATLQRQKRQFSKFADIARVTLARADLLT
jgi:uncharacterized protein YwgA